MGRVPNYLDWWRLGFEATAVVAEAQAVITLRLWGMAGLWPVLASENDRMVNEKAPAFARSGAAAFGAVMALSPPHVIAMAALKPIRARTRANFRRLGKAGIS